MRVLVALGFLLASASAFTTSPRWAGHARARSVKTNAAPSMDMAEVFANVPQAIAAAAASDGYEYGAVNAPGWVLPVGALAVILTAAVPVLLSPGEEALEQQRVDEETLRNEGRSSRRK
mmetsp:Transcript_70082/g.196107  ORF Transcript_70082/g.196107 Transcript_70082/m.196107 type:complete len:119 (-) Transcript_70082:1543-1899(-)